MIQSSRIIFLFSRIRILRLQSKTPIQTASQRAVASPQPVVNVNKIHFVYKP